MEELTAYLEQIPGIESPVANGSSDDGTWWAKFTIDIKHEFAWRVVQELGHIINYLSLDERLPTVFYPVSPPPYINGGPDEFLAWVIESKDKEFRPGKLKEWLQGRLPDPVDDPEQWEMDEEE